VSFAKAVSDGRLSEEAAWQAIIRQSLPDLSGTARKVSQCARNPLILLTPFSDPELAHTFEIAGKAMQS
jgi:hypothetical protein